MALSQRVIHQILACSSVVYLQFLIGVGYGWIAPTLTKFNDFHFTLDQISWLASINELGKFVGPFVAPLIVDNFGRRSTLFSVTIMYCVVWLSIIFTRNFYVLCAIRILLGFTNSINDVADCAYIAENCSPHMRGMVGSGLMLTYFIAVFSENIIGTYLSYTGTAVVNSLIAGSVLFTLYFCTETPYFLVMKGKSTKAKKNLTWLYGDASPEEVIEETRRIERSIEEERKKKESIRRLFFSPVNLRGIFLVVCMHVLGAASGTAAIVAYASYIFSPSESFTANEYAVLYSGMSLISAVLSTFIIEKFNRRSLFLVCCFGTICCNISSFILLYSHNAGYRIPYYPWLIFGTVSLYALFMGCKSPVAYALKGELLPFSVRAIGSGLCATGQSFSTFIIAKSFHPIANHFGMEFNFLIYAVASSLGTVIYYYYLPETRGKTLHELQHLKSKGVQTDDVDKETEEKLMSV